METQTTKRTHDVYEMVNFRIIDQLQKGTIPWQKPWNNSGLPENIVSRKAYRGINVVLLAMLGYEKNYFISQKQLKDMGGTPKEGEKPYLVTFWKEIDSTDPVVQESGEDKKTLRVLRYYMVYNIAQCDGIPKEKIPGFKKPKFNVGYCKQVIEGMPERPEVRESTTENIAYYNPEYDYITIPSYESFKKPEGYYGTLFHELIHSTGHTKRLARKELKDWSPFGSFTYSLEELTAEIGACYLKSLAGIPQRDLNNSVAYIQGWIAKFNDNPRMVVYAATQSQKAVDYILNVKFEEKGIVVTDEIGM